MLRFRSLLRNLTGEQYEDVINVCSMLPIVEMKVKPHGEFGSIDLFTDTAAILN